MEDLKVTEMDSRSFGMQLSHLPREEWKWETPINYKKKRDLTAQESRQAFGKLQYKIPMRKMVIAASGAILQWHIFENKVYWTLVGWANHNFTLTAKR